MVGSRLSAISEEILALILCFSAFSFIKSQKNHIFLTSEPVLQNYNQGKLSEAVKLFYFFLIFPYKAAVTSLIRITG